jgi:putative FmdB family regulatory protein
MPIFEYRCRKCGVEFETLVKQRDEKVKCAECGSEELERKLTTFSASVKSSSSGCAKREVCPAAAGGCGCASSCCSH